MAAQEGITAQERRIAAIGGILTGLALALRVILAPEPRVAAIDTAIVVAGGLFFAAGVRTRLARAGAGMFGNVALISWPVVAALALVRFAMQVAPALSDAAAPVADAFAVVSGAMLALVWVGIAVMALATAVGGMRSGTLARWFVGLSTIVAVASAIGVGTLLGDGGYFAWNGDYPIYLLYLVSAWFVLGGVAMWNEPDRPSA